MNLSLTSLSTANPCGYRIVEIIENKISGKVSAWECTLGKKNNTQNKKDIAIHLIPINENLDVKIVTYPESVELSIAYPNVKKWQSQFQISTVNFHLTAEIVCDFLLKIINKELRLFIIEEPLFLNIKRKQIVVIDLNADISSLKILEEIFWN